MLGKIKKFPFIGVMILLAVLASCIGCTQQIPISETTLPPATATSQVAVPATITATSVTPVATSANTETPTPASPVIYIAYEPTFVLQEGLGQVLILNLAIHNIGYNSFDTSPDYFSVIVNNKPYKYNPSLSDLRTLNVPNGGKVIGKLGFQVPSGTPSREVGFSMQYSGKQLYNVQWVNTLSR